MNIERWVELHGHDSYNVANLLVQDSNGEELKMYVMGLMNQLSEDEAVDLVEHVHEEFGDSR